jgi:formylglycine-generating enzyme required for sulfatase activity
MWATSVAGVTLDWVTIGDPGNEPDDQVMLCCETKIGLDHHTSGYGSVPYEYRITRTEVPTWAYVGFLNAVAGGADPNGLYHPWMTTFDVGTILRSGTSGNYTYGAKPERGDEPVVMMDWFRMARFVNWLHNGQPVGPQDASTTEDGAYPLLGGNPIGVPRNPGARYWIPTEDEWYKAAYHVPGGGYVDYATGTDEPPVGEPPPGGPNSANYCPPETLTTVSDPCDPEDSNGPGVATDVGAYPDSRSPWGIQDAVGNVIELMEEHYCCSPQNGQWMAPARGGPLHKALVDNAAFGRNFAFLSTNGCTGCGFRVATLVPEPAELALRVAALLCVALCGRAGARARTRRVPQPETET